MYEEILKACREWFYSIPDRLKTNIDVDNSKEFVANIDTDLYLSQIVVSEAVFRPYRFVEYTVMDILKEDTQPAFWYGDIKGDTVQEIIGNLDKGLKLLLSK